MDFLRVLNASKGAMRPSLIDDPNVTLTGACA
jgi:hypothetical protein